MTYNIDETKFLDDSHDCLEKTSIRDKVCIPANFTTIAHLVLCMRTALVLL